MGIVNGSSETSPGVRCGYIHGDQSRQSRRKKPHKGTHTMPLTGTAQAEREDGCSGTRHNECFVGGPKIESSMRHLVAQRTTLHRISQFTYRRSGRRYAVFQRHESRLEAREILASHSFVTLNKPWEVFRVSMCNVCNLWWDV